ncbi:cobalamin-independent methionine synthase, partial [Dietzia sp. E1]|nr:cobalamin-independent methionine synthase [Dietzia sp. E1]
GPPLTAPEAERPAAELLALLDRLGAPPHSGLPSIVLTPTADEIASAPGADAALRGARLVAETAPRMAE